MPIVHQLFRSNHSSIFFFKLYSITFSFLRFFLDDILKEYQQQVRDLPHFGTQRDVFISNESKQQFVSARIVPPEI